MNSEDDLFAAKARRNALRREQYAIDGGKRKEANRAWKEAHKEQVLDAAREYQRLRRADPATAEELRERVKIWRKNNPEKTKEMYAAWKAKNPGYHSEWTKKNKEKNPVLYLWRSVRSRAKAEGIKFDLRLEDIVVPAVCPALGISLRVGQRGGFTPDCASVDRIIAGLGYVKGNIAVISVKANVIKRDATPDELGKVAAYARRETERVLRERA